MTTNQALQFLEQGNVQDALIALRDRAFRDPCYKTYVNYAVALRHSGEFDSALTYLAKAVSMDPKPPHAYLALGNVSTELGEWQHALGYYEAAFVRVDVAGSKIAEIQQIALAYSQALLRAHMFKEAWPLWELGRFGRSYWALPGTKRWLGEPCDSLLVVCEGGYGDAMLFGRWLPFAKSRAKKVSLLIWDRMVHFRDWHALGMDEVIPKSLDLALGIAEYTTSWMSLPAIAGVKSVADIPADLGLFDLHKGQYLRFLETGDAWATPLIGFCWRAEENSQLRRSRSLDCVTSQSLADILSSHGQTVSLIPKQLALYRTEDFVVPSGVLQDEALIASWDATTQTIRSCKFVVTVDTAVAHLAGLCGVPTLLLLPRGSDWKWGAADNQPVDPWYGPHVHYYRNQDPLHWDVEAIAACITQLL